MAVVLHRRSSNPTDGRFAGLVFLIFLFIALLLLAFYCLLFLLKYTLRTYSTWIKTFGKWRDDRRRGKIEDFAELSYLDDLEGDDNSKDAIFPKFWEHEHYGASIQLTGSDQHKLKEKKCHRIGTAQD